MPEFFDNFNNDPFSIEVKTASYVIPSGQYARVQVIDFSTNFTIDGVAAIESDYISGSTNPFTSGVKYTNTTGKVLIGYVGQSSPATTEINSASNIISANPYSGAAQTMSSIGQIGVVIMPNDRIEVRSASAGTLWWKFSPDKEPGFSEFWVPSGTTLVGSRFIVELYNKQGA